jgi:HD-GYP domain-containing protein (c-di-GMP phosphodiesterase class II)
MTEPDAPQGIGLAELVSALSYALDMTEGQPAGHGVRCCWIGMNIAREIGMADSELSDLYYTLLLKDVGCTSNAARLCQLYLADDIALKRDFKFLDSSLSQVVGFVLSHTGMKAGLAERFRAMFQLALNGREFARELIETRCNRGADIARQMRFSDNVAKGILDLDEHWNGNGQPLGLKGAEISLFARIALMAQVIDVFFTNGGPDKALAEVRERSGVWFDPGLVGAFEQVSANPEFWQTLGDDKIQDHVIALQTRDHYRAVDEDYLDDIAAAFAQVVDAKSPFTSGHSDRVALFSDMLAEELGFSPERRRRLKRAEEWLDIKRHPALSALILSRVAAFSDLARIGGDHHERLDGKGYPRGIAGPDIDLETRIVTAADIFDALTADRPYRQAMAVGEAIAILRDAIGTQIDPEVFAALERAVDRVKPMFAIEEPDSKAA